jgi:nucleolar complex protein 2
MGNCLVELYSLDFQSSYQHTFVYIRELALQLRKAVAKKSPDAIQQVFGWQFLHSLKLWVAVLAEAATREDDDNNANMMSSLLYPLAEIILGMLRNMPSPVRLFPLRIQCIRLLQQLAATAQVFLPTTSMILECLDWKEWYAKPKKSSKRNTLRGGLPMQMLIKLPKEDPMRTQEQLEAAIVQVFALLDRDMELYRYTAAFPEYSVQIRQRCRDFAKAVQSSRWKAYAKGCMEKCDELASFCTLERAKLTVAPKDVAQLECLRPSHAPTMRERHRKALEQETKASQ